MSGSNRIAICFVGAIICGTLAVTTPYGVQATIGWVACSFLFGASFGLWWS